MENRQRVHEPFVFSALFFALTAGFGYAAVLVIAPALGYSAGPWWLATVQAHGYAQLFGWAGLFVLGVGLFFIPRLRGTVLARPELAYSALACFILGIGLRVLLQPAVAILAGPAVSGSAWASVARLGIVVSALLQVAGTLLVIVMLTATFRRAPPLGTQAPLRPVRGLLALGLISLAVSGLLNLLLAIDLVARSGYTYLYAWDDALTHLMIMGFIVPISLALSVRNLPLFMRLAFPPRRELGPLLAVLVLGLIARLIGGIERAFFPLPAFAWQLTGLGQVLEGSALLAFIWMIDIPLRRKRPWTESRIPTPPDIAAARKPTRKNYPDYGEYGRFELLIISAYLWFAFAAIIAVLNGGAEIVSASVIFDPDVERHALTVGYITLLILGMAVRMLPGFSGKQKVASTRLVLATFCLGNLAAFLRVAPLLKPDLPLSSAGLASSGVIGWLAVAALAVNLWRTFRPPQARKARPASPSST